MSTGYEVLDTVENIVYWFETYTEMVTTFGETVIWDCENKVYTLHYEEEDELSAFLDSFTFKVEMEIQDEHSINEL